MKNGFTPQNVYLSTERFFIKRYITIHMSVCWSEHLKIFSRAVLNALLKMVSRPFSIKVHFSTLLCVGGTNRYLNIFEIFNLLVGSTGLLGNNPTALIIGLASFSKIDRTG